MSIIQNIKNAMREAGHAVSEGEQLLTEDLRHMYDYLFFNHGIGRHQAMNALAYPEDQKEPLKAILLGAFDKVKEKVEEVVHDVEAKIEGVVATDTTEVKTDVAAAESEVKDTVATDTTEVKDAVENVVTEVKDTAEEVKQEVVGETPPVAPEQAAPTPEVKQEGELQAAPQEQAAQDTTKEFQTQ